MPDGARVPAAPQPTEEYRARAHALGYGEDVLRSCIEHELVHHLLAGMLGLDASPALARVAAGLTEGSALTGSEEDAVLAIQRFANAAGVRLIDRVRDG